MKSKIQFNKSFIETILDKLKIGNRRGIHLNAIPGHARSRIDLFHLNYLKEKYALEFFDKLTSESDFTFDINLNNIDLNRVDDDTKHRIFFVSKKIDNIIYDHEDQYKEFGIKNFGFGYPLLIKRDKNNPDKIIKAPLFIWKLDIYKSHRKANSWQVLKKENYPILINELLRSYILKDIDINIEQLSDEILEDNILDKNEIREICNKILNQINNKKNQITSNLITINECVSNDEINKITGDEAWIQWSGVFGLYKSRKETIINSNEQIINNIDKFQEIELNIDDFRTSTVSSVDIDPSKEKIINSLTKNEFKLIQGPPGTGKSKAITAIITNILANGGKCLVICEKKTALDVIYNNLDKDELKLSKYCALIDDVNNDKKKVIRKARNRVEKDSLYCNQFAIDNFNTKNKEIKSLKENINEKLLITSKKIFGEKRWIDLLGCYLRLSKEQNNNLLIKNFQISNEYDLNYDEYHKIEKLILEAKNIYQNISNNSFKYLDRIPKDKFLNDYSKLYEDNIKRNIDNKIDIINKIIEISYNQKFKSYSLSNNKIRKIEEIDKFIQDNNDVKKIITESLELINKYELLGRETDNIKIKTVEIFKSIFAKRYKQIIKFKQQLLLNLSNINKIIDFYDNDLLTSIEIEYNESIKHYKKELIKYDQNCKLVLNKYNYFKEMLIKILDCEKNIKEQSLIINSDLNILENDNYKEYQQKIIQYLDQLNDFKKEMKYYRYYHQWNYFISNIDSQYQKLIKQLLEYEVCEWINIFQTWYYYNLLLKYEDNNMLKPITSNYDLEKLDNGFKNLKKTQLNKIQAILNKRLESCKNDYEKKGNFHILYNLAKNKKYPRSNSLRKIISESFDLFSSIFPIILTNPIAADSILPLELGLFDVVIFDEASQLKIEDTFSSLIRGKFKVISGDEHQMPPSNYFTAGGQDNNGFFDETYDSEIIAQQQATSESLLEYAETLKIDKENKSYLDYHYRSNNSALINFSNYAIYGNNLKIMNQSENDSCPIEFYQLNGKNRDRVNQKEADKVIDILKNKIIFSDQAIPSIGIATFNIDQRNAIKDRIYLEREKDKKFDNKMILIESNKFFVKNLENIQGDEVDNVIISTTYGLNEDNIFYERYGPINQDHGYKLLNVLITRAKNKIYICTSIPEKKYLNYKIYTEQYGNNKKAIFYSYLAYCKAISENDIKKSKYILDFVKKFTKENHREEYQSVRLTESPFEEEVLNILQDKYPNLKIQPQYETGSFRIDFVIFKGDKKIAIECDGKSYHSSDEAYAYDMFRQKEIEKIGFIVYRIWSTNWFYDNKTEIDKMFNFIDNIKSYSSTSCDK